MFKIQEGQWKQKKKKKGFKNTKHVIEEPVYIVLLVAVEEFKGFWIALMCQLLAAMS